MGQLASTVTCICEISIKSEQIYFCKVCYRGKFVSQEYHVEFIGKDHSSKSCLHGIFILGTTG